MQNLDEYKDKTPEELNLLKLKLEVQQLDFKNQELSMKIINEKEEKKNKVNQRLKNWVSICSMGLTLLGAIAVIWNAYQPLVNYIEKRSNEYSFHLDNQLLTLIDKHSTSDPEKRKLSISLLGYYEDDALPFLFYLLHNNDQEKVLIQNTISAMYNQEKRSRTFEVILGSFDQLTDQIVLASDLNEISVKYQYGLNNDLEIFRQLDLGFWRKLELKNKLMAFKLRFSSKTFSDEDKKKDVKTVVITALDALINNL